MSAAPQHFDVIVIGAGPSGLSAATELKRLGVGSVLVVERERDAGGIPRHCLHSIYGLREWKRPMFGPAYARRLVAEADRAGVEIWCNTTVTALKAGGEIDISSDRGVQTLTARAVLLAMGARETPRAARLVGGTKPSGVMNTATLQSFAAFSNHIPFERPVIVGTELVSFSALLTCRTLGAKPVAMVDAADHPTTRAFSTLAPRLLGVPLYLRTRITAIHGRSQVEGITVQDDAKGTRDVACDGVVFTGGFRPENALLRRSGFAIDPGSLGPQIDQYGRLADPCYYSAGNVLHPIETAGWCWSEGRKVARCIMAGLRGILPPRGDFLLRATPLTAQDDGTVKFAVPQVLSQSVQNVAPAFDPVQLRLTTPFRGKIEIGGKAHRVASKPERRVLLPLPQSPPHPQTMERQT